MPLTDTAPIGKRHTEEAKDTTQKKKTGCTLTILGREHAAQMEPWREKVCRFKFGKTKIMYLVINREVQIALMVHMLCPRITVQY